MEYLLFYHIVLVKGWEGASLASSSSWWLLASLACGLVTQISLCLYVVFPSACLCVRSSSS